MSQPPPQNAGYSAPWGNPYTPPSGPLTGHGATPSDITNLPLPETHVPGSVLDRIAARRRQNTDSEVDPSLPNSLAEIEAESRLEKQPIDQVEPDENDEPSALPCRPGDLKQIIGTIKSSKRFKPESIADLNRLGDLQVCPLY